MEGGLWRGWEGGLPSLGAEAGSVPGGRRAGLRRWMEKGSQFEGGRNVGNGKGQGKGLNRLGRGGGLLGGDRTKTNLQDMRRRGMSGECSEGVGGMVREPESVEESLERNFSEESSGRAGNWEGRMRGVKKTASAGEWLESSWGLDQKERRKNPIRGSTASCESALRRRWVLLIIPLDWGWKAVVWIWEIWRRVVRED